MQTDFKFALVGSGRVARHFRHYLQILALPFVTWSRRENLEPFETMTERSSHVLLAVSDGAIEPLAKRCHSNQTVVHFSGSLRVPGTISAHPLMSFPEELQTPEWYRRVPFVVDQEHALTELLPGWPNIGFPIDPSQRPYYHALCSLAGNWPYLFWRQIGVSFIRDFKLPKEVLLPFLHQAVENAFTGQAPPVTGPVARADWQTVNAHLKALQPKPNWLETYQTYLRQAQKCGVDIPLEISP